MSPHKHRKRQHVSSHAGTLPPSSGSEGGSKRKSSTTRQPPPPSPRHARRHTVSAARWWLGHFVCVVAVFRVSPFFRPHGFAKLRAFHTFLLYLLLLERSARERRSSSFTPRCLQENVLTVSSRLVPVQTVSIIVNTTITVPFRETTTTHSQSIIVRVRGQKTTKHNTTQNHKTTPILALMALF